MQQCDVGVGVAHGELERLAHGQHRHVHVDLIDVCSQPVDLQTLLVRLLLGEPVPPHSTPQGGGIVHAKATGQRLQEQRLA
jgi:hypothetical protein